METLLKGRARSKAIKNDLKIFNVECRNTTDDISSEE
jgi:hypothetical protein